MSKENISKIKTTISNVFSNRRLIGASMALISLLIMGFQGNWYFGIGLALLFFAVGFLTQPVLLYLLWVGSCVYLACCYPSWMIYKRFIDLSGYKISLNILCIIIVCGFFLLVFGRVRPAVSTASGALLLLCIVNQYVYQFRGSELQWADLQSVRTALNVVGGYSFQLHPVIVKCLLCWIWTMFAAGALPKEPTSPTRPLILRICGAVAAIVCCILFCQHSTFLSPYGWDTRGSENNGFLLNFSLGIRDSVIRKPEGYSDLISQLEAQYPVQEAALPEELPNIVVIMDESFVDMRVMGDLKTNQPVTPFLDSLTDNTIRGIALSSVFGGSTACSEFEFLTGSSMAFLPNASIAYQQYMRQTTYSLPWLLQSYGYETFATHPYFENGWNRKTAYELLGFQSATFLGAYPEEDMVRDYVSDREMFQYVLNRLDQQGDAPLFLFGITMQNHGGYTDTDYKSTITLQGESYYKAEQYLSLIHETDEALEYLLSELENAPRKTIVLIFGDHFPVVEEEFYSSLHDSFDTLSDQMLRYQVPFYIWANYDIPEQTGEFTSLNYLPIRLMEAAGLPLSSFYQFLSDVRADIPAINHFGFYSSAGDLLTQDQADSKQSHWLSLYEAAQYNNIFGKKERSQILFP